METQSFTDEDEPVVNDSLNDLLQSCVAITSLSLSCKTLESNEKGWYYHQYNHADYNDNDNDVDDDDETMMMEDQIAIQNEQDVGKWLDAQIKEYEAAIIRQDLLMASKKVNDDDDDDNDKTTNEGKISNEISNEQMIASMPKRKSTFQLSQTTERVKKIKQELFDETVRSEQERLLIHRIQMSAASKCVAFPSANAFEKEKTKKNPKFDSSEIFLTKESLRIRDDQVLKAILSKKKVDEYNTKIREIKKEIRGIKEKNHDLWNQFQNASSNESSQSSMIERENSDEKLDVTSKQLIRLKKENEIFKSCYLNMIASAGIDWYADHRLCKTVLELENE